jgi:hypothetical protein
LNGVGFALARLIQWVKQLAGARPASTLFRFVQSTVQSSGMGIGTVAGSELRVASVSAAKAARRASAGDISASSASLDRIAVGSGFPARPARFDPRQRSNRPSSVKVADARQAAARREALRWRRRQRLIGSRGETNHGT